MSLLVKYESIIAGGLLRRDEQQVKVIKKLESLCEAISLKQSNNNNKVSKPIIKFKEVWEGLFGICQREKSLLPSLQQGIYIYGGVGSGKTMLMDLFYANCCPPPQVSKRRVHYNAFMLDIHSRLHELKSEKVPNPIGKVAESIAKEGKLLCLDEFQVVDVADAMLLRNLMENLFERDLKFVITSNRHPKDLYLNGIQRTSFIPCIELMERKLEIINLTSPTDYRVKEKQGGGAFPCEPKIFQWPINQSTSDRVREIFNGLCRGGMVSSQTIYTHGRPIKVKNCCGPIAMFSFEEVCGEALSAADYLCIASSFSKIVLLNVPIMDFSRRDEARRFITMIDIFYDNKIKLVMQSSSFPLELFQLKEGGGGTEGGQSNPNPKHPSQALRVLADDLSFSEKTMGETSLFNGSEEIFATNRTVSRLMEMQSLDWWPMEDHDNFFQ